MHAAAQQGSRLVSVLLLVAAVAATLGALGAFADTAHAVIWDPAAEPAWTAYPHGSFTGEDVASDVAIAGNGDVYVCGSNITLPGRAAALSKFVGPEIQWGGTMTWRGTGHDSDTARAIALGPRQAVYTAGLAERDGHDTDALLVKWSSTNGHVLWSRLYDGRAHGADGAVDVAVDRRGNIVVLGVVEGGDGHVDWLVRSYTASGRVRWTWRSDWSDSDDVPAELAIARDGSTYAAGFANGAGPARLAVVRLSSRGRRVWSRTYRGPDGHFAVGSALTPRPGGGVYVCGYVDMDGTGLDGLVVGYSASGRRSAFDVDSRGFDPTIEGFNDVAVTTTGVVVACGYTTEGALTQMHWASWDPDGGLRAVFTRASAGGDWMKAVAPDSWGGFCMTGKYTDAGGNERIIVDRQSTIPLGGGWSSQIVPAATTGNQPFAIAVRGGRCVVVGQADLDGATGLDQMIAAYLY